MFLEGEFDDGVRDMFSYVKPDARILDGFANVLFDALVGAGKATGITLFDFGTYKTFNSDLFMFMVTLMFYYDFLCYINFS